MIFSRGLTAAFLFLLAFLFVRCGSDENPDIEPDPGVAARTGNKTVARKPARKTRKNGPYLEIGHPKGKAAPPKSQFGTATAVFDLNGTGKMDIAVGSPGEGLVYVLSGPDFGKHRLIAPQDAQAKAGFGKVLLAADLDGQAGEELVVGAPFHTVDEKAQAGKVYIFGKRRPKGMGLTAVNPQPNARFGSCLAVGDVDGDKRLELIVGAPRAVSEDVAAGQVFVIDVLSRTTKFILTNHQKTKMANFGHDVAVADGNGDGIQDIFVSAIGNSSNKGLEKAGQVVFFPGPVKNGNRIIIENPAGRDGDESRFGMSLWTGDVNEDGCADLLVGAPRNDVQKVQDAGLGFVFRGPDFDPKNASAKARLDPNPTANDILGFRVRFGNVIGDERPDMIFSSMAEPKPGHPKALVIWDGAKPNKDPVVLPAMEGASSHYLEGITVAQLDGAGYDELILGDPRFSSGSGESVGRVMILYLK